jgi:heme-degrading monooxygenase HmoA
VIVQVVKYKTGLSEEEAAQTIASRAPQYRALPGLWQKLYVREQGTGEYGGIYVWEDEASMRTFRESELAATIPEAYRVEGEPRVEIFDVVSILRADEGAPPPLDADAE